MTIYGQDTFIRANTTSPSWGTGTDGQAWNHAAGSATSYNVQSNEGVIANTPGLWDQFTYGANFSITGTQEISVRVICDSTSEGFGVMLRPNSTSSTGYFAMYDGTLVTPGLVIYRNSGGLTSLASSAFPVTATSAYWVKAKISSGTIQAKIWLDGTGEPAYSLSASDSTYTSGGIGVIGNASANLKFDHFLATDGAAGGAVMPPNYFPKSYMIW